MRTYRLPTPVSDTVISRVETVTWTPLVSLKPVMMIADAEQNFPADRAESDHRLAACPIRVATKRCTLNSIL